MTRLRLLGVTLATTALATVTTLAAGPAQAQGQGHDTFTKHAQKRATSRMLTSQGATQATTAVPVHRFAGTDRIDTAVQASFGVWDAAGTVDGNLAQAVVLSRYDEYADALGGSALAGAAVGPLLLTHPTALDTTVKDEIDRVLGGKGTVYVLGGVGAISADVEAALTQAGYTVVRLAGADRYDTSVAVATEVGKLAPGGKPNFVFATTGLNFPDGLAAGATAGGYWASVVLTRDTTLNPSVSTYLDSMKGQSVEEYAVGGAAAAVARSWDATYVGADRFETAAMVAEDFWGNPDSTNDDPAGIGLATGLNWPDALSGGAFVAGAGPLVLTWTDTLPTTTSTAVQALVASGSPSPVQFGAIFGGEAVVGTNAESQFTALLNP